MGATNPAFSTYAIASTIVALHMILLAFYTGSVRGRRKQYGNAEDAAFFKVAVTDGEHADVLRVKRAHANALESGVPFFAVGALYVTVGQSKAAALAYFGSFVVARLLHSVVYIWGKQPLRTIFFAVGALSIIGMAVHVLRFYA
jgi:prostaglandin-E synthase 1